MLISDLLSRPVITIYEASMVGTAISALFDKKMRRLYALLAVNEDDEDEAMHVVPMARVKSADNALTIKNLIPVKKYEEDPLLVKCPINKNVFTTQGEAKGVIKDIEYNEDTLEVISILTDQGAITPSEVISVSDSLVIIKGEGFTRVQPPRKRKAASIGEESFAPEPAKAVPLVFQDAAEEEELSRDEEITSPVTPRYGITPARIISDYSFLLGRRVLQNVYSTTGELIIPGNTVIKTETVEIARKHGKLVELTVGSRL